MQVTRCGMAEGPVLCLCPTHLMQGIQCVALASSEEFVYKREIVLRIFRFKLIYLKCACTMLIFLNVRSYASLLFSLQGV